LPSELMSSPEFVPLKIAAAALGESTENTRLRAKRGALVAKQRGRRNEWFIESKSLAKLLGDLGRTPRTAPAIDELAAEVRLLAAEVEALKGRASTSDDEVQSLRLERDRYRAEASTMRETAIRANAAQRAAAAGFRQVLEALEEQANALTELLGPRSPSEFGVSDE
jgi:chromosome segregation ATPase